MSRQDPSSVSALTRRSTFFHKGRGKTGAPAAICGRPPLEGRESKSRNDAFTPTAGAGRWVGAAPIVTTAHLDSSSCIN
jgi:hypothetical protein